MKLLSYIPNALKFVVKFGAIIALVVKVAQFAHDEYEAYLETQKTKNVENEQKLSE